MADPPESATGRAPAPSRRLFLALWPSAAEARALGAYARGLPCPDARPVPAERLHLTLAFLGDVRAEADDTLLRVVRSVRAPAFALPLDRVGAWLGQGIVWAGCARPPAALAVLVEELRSGLAAAGFRVERRPFQAHVTLYRKARTLAACAPPGLSWRCSRFVLVESTLEAMGPRYRRVAAFGLTSAPAEPL